MSLKRLSDLAPHGRELATASLDWAEQFWDPAAHLLRIGPPDSPNTGHSVRNSIWFALGLLLRNQPGDGARAQAIIHAVLDNQYDAPGTVYHGTFRRTPTEPPPPAAAVVWRDYDPNWRQFIGTTLAIIQETYGPQLSGALRQRIDRAIQTAIVSEPDDRCPPSYTNIALMKAALLTWGSQRYDRPEWRTQGEAFGAQVYALFQEYKAFFEYNSPTYYGVDFYALAFWRLYAHSPKLAEMGAAMEEAVWRDVARFYHAEMRNVCGPYSRSYGMDMEHYAALLGMSIWLGVGRTDAPFPQRTDYFDHSHDFVFGPPFGMLDTRIPADALPHFQSFQGERQIRRRISTVPNRVATAWLSERVMMGGEWVALDDPATLSAYKPNDQYHPVTMHWLMPDEQVGWMRLRHVGPVSAQATTGRLGLQGRLVDALDSAYSLDHRTYLFQLHVPGGVDAQTLRADAWDLPGLSLRVKTDMTLADVRVHDEMVEICYRQAAPKARLSLHVVGNA